MPFMDPCLSMCLCVGLPASVSGIVQLVLPRCLRSFSGKNVLLLLFEKLRVVNIFEQIGVFFLFVTRLRASIMTPNNFVHSLHIYTFFQLYTHTDFLKCEAISSVSLTGGHLFQGINQ